MDTLYYIMTVRQMIVHLLIVHSITKRKVKKIEKTWELDGHSQAKGIMSPKAASIEAVLSDAV